MWPFVAVLSWVTIGAVMLVRFGARVVRLHRALASGPAVSSDDLRQMVVALGADGDRAPIRLTTSETCAIPLALPGRRIVLPERFLQQLDAEHQRAALAHEIAHVIRHDPAWRILVGTLERAFFFQPLNRVARAKLCDSAEFLCDQWAVQQTRSPLALARCLSIVASWASPASDRISAGASTMARGDSPIVRRVTRILNEPACPARRPSAVWLAPPLAVVAMAAPLVTAAQLSHHPADAARLSSPLAMAMNTSTSGEQQQKDEPSSPRVWSASELAQARARLRVHRPPRPSDPLADRWRWALDDARRQGIGDFWIVYRFDTPTHAQDSHDERHARGHDREHERPPDHARTTPRRFARRHWGRRQRYSADSLRRRPSRCDRPRRLSQHATRLRLWTHAGVLAGQRTRGPELRTRSRTVRARQETRRFRN